MTKPYEQQNSDIDIDDAYKVEDPKRYKVLLHNDDYTTMEFVLLVLEDVFNKTSAQAQEIMMKVHEKGVGVCGVYCFEVAETKAQKVDGMAKSEGYPLKISIEEYE
jgi:ATP-dependent Clp protease adaptor protein ClpS